MIFLTSNSFFLCWLAMPGSFHPVWSLSQSMGHALLLCPYFRDLTACKYLILSVAHFNFFLVGIPVFRELFFLKLSILVVGFLASVAPVGGLNWSTLRSLSQGSDSIVRFWTRSCTSLRTQTSCHSVRSACFGSWSQAPSMLCCSVSSVTGPWLPWRICMWVWQKWD